MQPFLPTKLKHTRKLMHGCPVQDRETVVLPRKADAASALNMATLSVHMALEFKSETLRSGAVVLSDDAPVGSALLFLKGAPAVIASLVDPDTIPADFQQVHATNKWACDNWCWSCCLSEAHVDFNNVMCSTAVCPSNARICLQCAMPK